MSGSIEYTPIPRGSSFSIDNLSPCSFSPKYSLGIDGSLVLDLSDKKSLQDHQKAYKRFISTSSIGLPAVASVTEPAKTKVGLIAAMLRIDDEHYNPQCDAYRVTVAPIPGRMQWSDMNAVLHLFKTKWKDAIHSFQEQGIVPYGLQNLSSVHWSHTDRKFYALNPQYWELDSGFFGHASITPRAQQFYSNALKVNEQSFAAAAARARAGESLDQIALFESRL